MENNYASIEVSAVVQLLIAASKIDSNSSGLDFCYPSFRRAVLLPTISLSREVLWACLSTYQQKKILLNWSLAFTMLGKKKKLEKRRKPLWQFCQPASLQLTASSINGHTFPDLLEAVRPSTFVSLWDVSNSHFLILHPHIILHVLFLKAHFISENFYLF